MCHIQSDDAVRGTAAPSMAEYEAAIRSEPASALARFNFCVLLSRLGRHTEAIEQCRAAVALAPASPRIVNGHIGILEAPGHVDEARQRSGHR